MALPIYIQNFKFHGVPPTMHTLLRRRKRTIARKGLMENVYEREYGRGSLSLTKENVVVFRSNVASVVDIIKLAVTHIAVRSHEL